ncbi:CD63 antigen-like [Oryzias latipes]|uniref:CD63 antigen-like n=1 Tax=Oryzias latipes TaxID=8090 RepID=UPI0009DB00C7|nr:CD63 antigen-like [Oryzias latipes]
MVIGVLQHSTYSQFGNFTGSSLSKISIVLIVVGVSIVLVSLLGHIGAFMENTSMLGSFICILIVILLLELLTGGAFYILHSRTALLKMNSDINTKTREAIYKYDPENRDPVNRIQEKLSCCGADTYTDWYRSGGWAKQDAVPDSCCVVKKPGCGQQKEEINKKGCSMAIKLFLLKNIVWVGAVCIGLGITAVFGVLVGICLCLNIKRKNYQNLD